MAIYIGTNFSYQGGLYLDERQGMADTLEDLKNWDILVPEGFEAYCKEQGQWYIWRSKNNSPTTGKFTLRYLDGATPVVQEKGNSKTSVMSQDAVTRELSTVGGDLSELMDEVFKLSFKSFTGGATQEVGSSVTPRMTWTIQRKGAEVNPTTATVNGAATGVSADKKSWTGSGAITTNTTYNLLVNVGTQSISRSAAYTFKYKKYWGVSTKATLTNSDILGLSSTWADGRAMGATSFNCTGGKYPYYILPASLYPGLVVEIGLPTTDLNVTDIELTNQSGARHAYKVVRLGELQYGVLSITFK